MIRKELVSPKAIYCSKCEEQLLYCLCCGDEDDIFNGSRLGVNEGNAFRFNHVCVDGAEHEPQTTKEKVEK